MAGLMAQLEQQRQLLANHDIMTHEPITKPCAGRADGQGSQEGSANDGSAHQRTNVTHTAMAVAATGAPRAEIAAEVTHRAVNYPVESTTGVGNAFGRGNPWDANGNPWDDSSESGGRPTFGSTPVRDLSNLQMD